VLNKQPQETDKGWSLRGEGSWTRGRKLLKQRIGLDTTKKELNLFLYRCEIQSLTPREESKKSAGEKYLT
jgi:hypothetical protein